MPRIDKKRLRRAQARFQPEIVDYRSIEAALLGELIVARRRYHAVNQLDLAMAVGITPAAMCRIEKGQSSPRVSTLSAICAALQCSLQQLIYPVEPELADHKKAALSARANSKRRA